MKHLSLIIFSLILLISSSCKKQEKVVKKSDFETLMGSTLPAWKHVQTEEDFTNLAFFKKVYEQNIAKLTEEYNEIKIPKVIHFIWIGPKSFPIESIENVRTWVAKHPDWKIKFWTDRQRPLPHPKMELCLVRDFPFHKLEEFYHQSENYAEKSDLLRLEILYREGGIYADHDVTCFKSFDPLVRGYDLFCGMEVPFPTTLSSSVLPTNNLLGARPGHLLLSNCMDWLGENWQRIEREYPGKDRDAIINRVSHRTFRVLGEIFKLHSNQEGNIDIAFPSYYFNAPKVEDAIFARHQYKGTWFENESEFEKMARKRLMMLSKKTNKILLAVAVLSGLNLLGFALLGSALLRKKKAQ